MPSTPDTRSPTLFIADPSAAFRSAVRMLISARAPEWTLLGEAADAEGTLEALSRLAPDVILVERVLPDGSTLNLLESFRDACPSARVVVTSVDWDPATMEAALERGAAGVLPKLATADLLVAALRRVDEGGVFRPGA